MNNKDIERFMNKVNKTGIWNKELSSYCWTWLAQTDKDGYGRFRYNNRKVGSHRFSYELFFGIEPLDNLVCHKCDNPSCVNPDHLFLGSWLDNIVDRTLKGRGATGTKNGKYTKPEKTPKGEKCGNSKLTECFVKEIRKEYNREKGKTLEFLSKKYNVGISTIHSIVKRITWKHVID